MTSRGLVLGGGGITGIAWETGLLAGLAEQGVDLTVADRIVGTSAGSVVGAQLAAGIAVDQLYARQLEPPADGAPLARIGLGVVSQMALSMLQARGDVERFGQLLGARALRAAGRGLTPTVEERYAQVRQRIGGLDWTERDLVVTAVDVATGRLTTFGPQSRHPQVSLEDAVNASCAVPCVYPPIRIEGRLHIDGGVRSGANADLAAGCSAIVALTPVDRSVGPLRSAAQQLASLDVPHLVVSPDAAAREAIGRNVLDPAARPASARAGHAQAAAVADRVRAVWG